MRRTAIVTTAGLAAMLLPGPALAADTAQTTTFALAGPGAKGMTASALAPATKTGSQIVLGWRTVATKSGPVIRHSGSILLRAGDRSITLSQLQYVSGKNRTVKARVAGKTITAFTLAKTKNTTLTLASGATAPVATSDATPTASARRAIARALKLKRIASGRIGQVRWIGAATTTVDPGQTQPENPVSGCAGGPAPLARPATAVPVTAAQMTWHVRESFIRYINGGEGSSASDGATAASPQVIAPSTDPLVYDYSYTYSGGWTDPASGQTRLLFTGRVGFKWKAHGIDLALTGPEIEISPSGSRAIFCMANLATQGETLKRSTLVTLDSSGGTAKMNGTVPAGAAEGTFSGYYFPGEPFGHIGVTGITTP